MTPEVYEINEKEPTADLHITVASHWFWLSVRIGQVLDTFNDYEVADG